MNPVQLVSLFSILRFRLSLTTLLFCLFALTCPLTAEEVVWLTSDGEPLGSHVIGDSVVGRLSGVSAGQSFDLILEDDTGFVIATARVVSDAAGQIPTTVLWVQSGVVGCDAYHGYGNQFPNLAAYRFARFEEAEQLLVARNFQLLLLNADDQTLVSARALPLEIGTEPRFFFSDGTGCPRNTVMNNEDVYLSATHLPANLESVYVFLVPAHEAWSEGMALNDVRPDYQATPQTLTLSGGGAMTQLLWQAAATIPGQLEGFIRRGDKESASIAYVDDWWTRKRPHQDHSTDGLTIDDVPLDQDNPDDPAGEDDN